MHDVIHRDEGIDEDVAYNAWNILQFIGEKCFLVDIFTIKGIGKNFFRLTLQDCSVESIRLWSVFVFAYYRAATFSGFPLLRIPL